MTDEQSHGLSGVTVAVQPPRASGPPATTTSDDRGHYWIDAEPGDYDVTFYLRDVVVQAKVHVSRDHVTRLDRAIRINYPDATEALRSEPQQERLHSKSGIDGVISDQKTHERLYGVTVTAAIAGKPGVWNELSDQNGIFALPDLPPGIYSVTFFYGDVQVEVTDVPVEAGHSTVVDVTLDQARPGTKTVTHFHP